MSMKKIIQLESVNLDDFVFVDEAAEILELKEGVIRNYLNLGKFITYKFKKKTFLNRIEIEAWKNKII